MTLAEVKIDGVPLQSVDETPSGRETGMANGFTVQHHESSQGPVTLIRQEFFQDKTTGKLKSELTPVSGVFIHPGQIADLEVSVPGRSAPVRVQVIHHAKTRKIAVT